MVIFKRCSLRGGSLSSVNRCVFGQVKHLCLSRTALTKLYNNLDYVRKTEAIQEGAHSQRQHLNNSNVTIFPRLETLCSAMSPTLHQLSQTFFDSEPDHIVWITPHFLYIYRKKDEQKELCMVLVKSICWWVCILFHHRSKFAWNSSIRIFTPQKQMRELWISNSKSYFVGNFLMNNIRSNQTNSNFSRWFFSTLQ